VRTWEGAEVIVPNGNLVSNDVINWTLSDRQRRIEIPVGVAYGSPVKKVMEILTAVASQNEDVLESPAPYALFIGFGDSSLDFALRFWTARFEGYFRVRSAVLVAFEEALNEAGIVIPFPQRDLHVKTVAPQAGRTLHGEAASDSSEASDPSEAPDLSDASDTPGAYPAPAAPSDDDKNRG